MNDIFLTTEQVIISAIKAQILTMTQTKQIFWNGVSKDCIIAGGVFASLINDEAIKDIDVFILNTNTPVYNHFTDGCRKSTEWVTRSDAGMYLQNPHILKTAFNVVTKVQYILTDYTSREELLKSFDYKHCTVSYDPSAMKLYITRSAFDAIRNKQLIPNNEIQKTWRYEKFIKRGWRMFAIDHHQGLDDGFSKIIKDAVGDMLNRHGTAEGVIGYQTK